ncbi:MAG: FAD binding domain-containing protein [Lachnospiraceae bacterium]
MLKFKQYYRVKSLAEAYELNQKKSNVVLGGMLWLKLQRRTVGGVIDLSDLGLDRITETDESFTIGAMVSLRDLEQHEGLRAYLGEALHESLRHIVGVQFRNVATVGGSIFGRFGFSDVLTLFLALDAKVKFYHTGEMPLSVYASAAPLDKELKNDILEAVILPKHVEAVAYRSVRNSETDFPVLTCCAAKVNGIYRVSVGARPMRAAYTADLNDMLKDEITPESAAAFGTWVSEQFVTGSNVRASGDYRKKMIAVLTKRNVMDLAEAEKAVHAQAAEVQAKGGQA